MSNQKKKKDKNKKKNGGETSKLIPSDLYNEVTKFVDKNTLLEYMETIQQTNESIIKDLKQAYEEKFRPFEESFLYKDFPYATEPDDAFFRAKPMILLIGQYSSGKSTFVKYLIDKDYPGIRIGPEPTTDKFVAVMYGEENSIIPGNALVNDDRKRFKPLTKFGGNFLNRFQAAQVNSTVLKGITIIDTPGILSDTNNSAGYDFKGVIEWFAQQSDRIFLFVDAHKLELSGTFQKIIEMIRKYDDKLRIVLNKTDLVTEQEMIRIFGALMWFLGQSLEMKEVIQIYVGSFWGKPFGDEKRRKLYEHEEFRIYEDLSNLPQESLLRKINCLVRRTRQVSMHACLISMVKDNIRRTSLLRFIFDKQIKKIYLRKLHKIRAKIEKQYNFTRDESPDLNQMKRALMSINLNRRKTFNKKLFAAKDVFIHEDLPNMIDRINNGKFPKMIFEANNEGTPFGFAKGEGFDEGSTEPSNWIVVKYLENYQTLFNELKTQDGKVTASKAKAEMLKSNLPAKILNKIWNWSDIDRDGMLDRDEFALAMFLVSVTLKNYDLPEQLPRHLIPPSKRRMITINSQ
ncbi:EH domain-containing protein 3-like [Dermatophagoides pteronyssinus]|uniref:EH domain-containing protein 3-like n=1 Tax=Dermatophagoides pteronyssinus TaxID=6956 RepID=UPI003F666A5C